MGGTHLHPLSRKMENMERKTKTKENMWEQEKMKANGLTITCPFSTVAPLLRTL
jgi:hypothetical protein